MHPVVPRSIDDTEEPDEPEEGEVEYMEVEDDKDDKGEEVVQPRAVVVGREPITK